VTSRRGLNEQTDYPGTSRSGPAPDMSSPDAAKLRDQQAKVAPDGSDTTSWSPLAQRRRRSLLRRRGALVRRALLATDLVAFSLAFVVAEWLFGVGHTSLDDRLAIRTEFVVFVATLPVWLLVVNLYGLYGRDEERTDHSTADDVVPVFHVVTVGVWLFQGLAWVTGFAQPQFPKLLSFWAGAILLVTAGRLIARQICQRLPSYIQNTLILGLDDVGQLIARKLAQHPEYGLNLVGFVGSGNIQSAQPGQLPTLGTLDKLEEVIHERDVERVIVTCPADGPNGVKTIHRLKKCRVQIDIVPPLFEVVGPGIDIHSIEGVPLIGLPPTRLSRPSLFVKRTIDLVVSVALLVLTAPLFAWIAWRVRRDSRGPIFFRQTRLGLNMHELTMLKFRTMKIDADQDSHREYIKEIMDRGVAPSHNGLFKLERPDEITRFGRWLRKTSLDELPQLINVVKGDMSLVGPRPCLPYEVEHFESHHFERFTVPAGITGLWQVTARARSTFVEALEMDVSYARGWSLGLDLWLLARTPLQLLTQRGTT
jgi:exopolysaccharide biosynthesis polyprenyl glycosylphosphotransferase